MAVDCCLERSRTNGAQLCPDDMFLFLSCMHTHGDSCSGWHGEEWIRSVHFSLPTLTGSLGKEEPNLGVPRGLETNSLQAACQ